VKRTLEAEEMDTEQEALDYDAMDHHDVNERFCADLIAALPNVEPEHVQQMCDLGTGTARIPIVLCKRLLTCNVFALDLSHAMIRVATRNIHAAGLRERVFAQVDDAKRIASLTGGLRLDAVFSNSVVHHIPEPATFLAEAYAHVGKGGVLFVRDLVRPETPEEATRLANLYSPCRHDADRSRASEDQRASTERQWALLHASLHAALTVAEVQALVAPLGIPASAVTQTSDRHWTLAHQRS
jgi:SAM-dependent methyltransferase